MPDEDIKNDNSTVEINSETTNNINQEERKEKTEKKEENIKKDDIKKRKPHFLEGVTEFILRKLFFWEEDEKRLGMFIRFLHCSVMYMSIIWYVVIHTFIPSYILFVLFYIFVFLIWLQHITCGGCLVSKVEQKLIGDTSSFIDPILNIFHIPITPETSSNMVILGSSVILFMLTFELISRTIINVKNYIF